MNIKKIFCALIATIIFVSVSYAQPLWEKDGDFYFLTKNNRDNFSAQAGANKFRAKYIKYDGVDFLVKGADDWQDYGRLNLEGNNIFSVPVQKGIKVSELHLLAGGNFGNSYSHDALLKLYGDKYFYGSITVIFVYQDGAYRALSAPVFWDWFHLGGNAWSKDGAKIKPVGNNPVRKDCSIYHLSFVNPRSFEPIKDILIEDSWLSDMPFSEVFALTIKSSDALDAQLKEDKQFKDLIAVASFDGWMSGCSSNWDADAKWQKDVFGKKSVVFIPACNWGGDKFSWIEKKINLPDEDGLKLQFSRHGAVYSELDKKWSDSLLKVMINGQMVYEKVYSGEWFLESVDISRYRGKDIVVRFENHGGGDVRLSETTSPGCDGDDTVISDIQVI